MRPLPLDLQQLSWESLSGFGDRFLGRDVVFGIAAAARVLKMVPWHDAEEIGDGGPGPVGREEEEEEEEDDDDEGGGIVPWACGVGPPGPSPRTIPPHGPQNPKPEDF